MWNGDSTCRPSGGDVTTETQATTHGSLLCMHPSPAPVPPSDWVCRGRRLALSQRVHVMGVLNVTPDSFSDGGAFLDRSAAVDHALAMVEEGADIIDVGGESTRPGAEDVPVNIELERVIPVVEAVAGATEVAVSIDTTKAAVAKAALEAGAVIVNDISALRFDPAMPGVVESSGAGLILMHMQGRPRTMQANPTYADVVEDVAAELRKWAGQAEQAGIKRERIVVDPGIGFGKTRQHNLLLLKHLDRLTALGFPVLVGASRKSFIGSTLDLPVDERLEGTAAVTAWTVARGAAIVRVHDVREMVRIVRMVEAIKDA
jgi:dihydropteroate synthase